jgi:hypothetical protein
VILVDTSVWIELLNRKQKSVLSEKYLLEFCTCGPVIQEVLQGLKEDREADLFREFFSAIPIINDPLPRDTFVFASEIYRNGRRRGITVRSSIDCLIAAIAIENRATVWHRDRDFDAIAIYTELRATQRI